MYIKILKKGNFKYLKFYKSFFNKAKDKENYNWIKFISIFFGIIHFIFLIMFCFNSKKEIEDKNVNQSNNDSNKNINNSNNMDKNKNKDDSNKDNDSDIVHIESKNIIPYTHETQKENKPIYKKRRNSAIIMGVGRKEIFKKEETTSKEIMPNNNNIKHKNKIHKEISNKFKKYKQKYAINTRTKR